MYSFTWSYPNSVKRSWETVHLRGVGNFAWGAFLLGVGGKLDEELFWQFDSFVLLKTGWVIKLWWEDSTSGENNIIFLATVGDHNPPVGKILTCTLKNHNLLFIIKHFQSILGIIKNIWLWISENIILSTNFRKNASVNNFQNICQWWFSKLQ